MELTGIPDYEVVDVWPTVLPLINRVLDMSNGDYTAEYILGRIVDGDYQLWVGYMDNGAVLYTCVTRLEYFEATNKTALLGMWIAGDNMSEWIDGLLAELESWAIDVGADEMRCIGRPGWERVLKADGYKKTHTIFAKSLGVKQ